jgi:hypothetical protein
MYIQFFTMFATVVPKLMWGWGHQAVMLLYLGPETLMPLASILGAAVGFLLIFWRLLLKPFKKVLGAFNGKNHDEAESSASLTELHSDTQE